MSKLLNKISVVREILERKDVLFDAFSDKITKDMKVSGWKEILAKSQALEVVPSAKDFTYVRDVFWANVKRSTLAKKDNAARTGAAGGRSKKMNELDELVLQIIGRDSPLVQGIRPSGCMDEDSDFRDLVLQVLEDSVECEAIKCAQSPPTAVEKPPAAMNKHNLKRPKTYVTLGSKAYADTLEDTARKRRKTELVIQNLQLQDRKLQLEIFELEQKLKTMPSEHIKDLHQI